MANEEYLKILKQGVSVWNEWRRPHIATNIDFSFVNLNRMDLRGADLRSVNLNYANLNYADLYGADLYGAALHGVGLYHADLYGARLIRADLSRARLHSASLCHADLSYVKLNYSDLNHANLSNAKLIRAELIGANLISANLTEACLIEATAGGTGFGDIDLRVVKGLEAVKHSGHSELSTGTIYRSEGHIPEVFLRGCGLRDWEIEATKLYRTDLSRNQIIDLTYKVIELRTDPLLQFNSCFISYSSKNEEFASYLYSDLQKSGVRCWYAHEDMKIGDRIRNRLDDSIRLHDKLLLILSETSIASQWIEQEVETALEKEREQGCDVLFPIRLDDAVMRQNSGWPAFIKKTRHIGDFCEWKNPDEYQKGFKRLLNDLRVEVPR
jgi:uncharacterized protein YjbI with pentapeptide repeats